MFFDLGRGYEQTSSVVLHHGLPLSSGRGRPVRSFLWMTLAGRPLSSRAGVVAVGMETRPEPPLPGTSSRPGQSWTQAVAIDLAWSTGRACRPAGPWRWPASPPTPKSLGRLPSRSPRRRRGSVQGVCDLIRKLGCMTTFSYKKPNLLGAERRLTSFMSSRREEQATFALMAGEVCDA